MNLKSGNSNIPRVILWLLKNERVNLLQTNSSTLPLQQRMTTGSRNYRETVNKNIYHKKLLP